MRAAPPEIAYPMLYTASEEGVFQVLEALPSLIGGVLPLLEKPRKDDPMREHSFQGRWRSLLRVEDSWGTHRLAGSQGTIPERSQEPLAGTSMGTPYLMQGRGSDSTCIAFVLTDHWSLDTVVHWDEYLLPSWIKGDDGDPVLEALRELRLEDQTSVPADDAYLVSWEWEKASRAVLGHLLAHPLDLDPLHIAETIRLEKIPGMISTMSDTVRQAIRSDPSLVQWSPDPVIQEIVQDVWMRSPPDLFDQTTQTPHYWVAPLRTWRCAVQIQETLHRMAPG